MLTSSELDSDTWAYLIESFYAFSESEHYVRQALRQGNGSSDQGDDKPMDTLSGVGEKTKTIEGIQPTL